MQTYHFEGHDIRVDLRAFRTFCWLSGGLVVYADGRTFWPKPDRGPSFTTATEFELMIGGEQIAGSVRTLRPLWLLPRVECAVEVAGVEVGRAVQPLRHWVACYVAWTVVGAGVTFALFGMMAFAYVLLHATHRPARTRPPVHQRTDAYAPPAAHAAGSRSWYSISPALRTSSTPSSSRSA